VAFSPDGSYIASGGADGALKLWLAPSGADCNLPADCDDSNDCTTDHCVEGICRNTPTTDDISCNGGSGICCNGSCAPPTCTYDYDCDDGDACSEADTCLNGGTCAAVCNNSFPDCNSEASDSCCGPLCSHRNDVDCPCVPTHSKEKGPRCRDNIDNDCDGMMDGHDPDC
jgi:WD40 repeat protein